MNLTSDFNVGDTVTMRGYEGTFEIVAGRIVVDVKSSLGVGPVLTVRHESLSLSTRPCDHMVTTQTGTQRWDQALRTHQWPVKRLVHCPFCGDVIE